MSNNLTGIWRMQDGPNFMDFSSDNKLSLKFHFGRKYNCYCDAGGCDEWWILSGENIPYQISENSIIFPGSDLKAFYETHHNWVKSEKNLTDFKIDFDNSTEGQLSINYTIYEEPFSPKLFKQSA